MNRRVEPRLVKGFRDIFSDDLLRRQQMIDVIRGVYESYGYLPLETPAVEFVDVLGKFLPDSDQPEEGIFSFKAEGQWLALRYDLTAPLSRVVAMYKELPRPFRRYQVGPVWRLEKPGPGRFREFYQFDIDIVGSESPAADAEICMVLADAFEALGFKRGEYIIKISNRKFLDAAVDKALETLKEDQLRKYLQVRGETRKSSADLMSDQQLRQRHRLDIFRSIDKLERIGYEGVEQLLTEGRRDETGDFTPGCFLRGNQLEPILQFLQLDFPARGDFLTNVGRIIIGPSGAEARLQLEQMDKLFTAAGYGEDCLRFDSRIVRGMTYYTGPIFEAVLTHTVTDEDGRTVQFGSVAGGGRYDGLVERFTGEKIPATGASIGVDRLLAACGDRAMQVRGKDRVLVTVMDAPRLAEYQMMATELRRNGITCELYLGQKGIGGQLKYADQRQAVVAVIAGEDEFAQGVVTIKDLRLGTKLSAEIAQRDQWRKDQPAQFQVPRERLVEAVKEVLKRYA